MKEGRYRLEGNIFVIEGKKYVIRERKEEKRSNPKPKIERNFRKWKLLSTQVFWGALIVAEAISLFKKPAQCLLSFHKYPPYNKGYLCQTLTHKMGGVQ